MSWTTGRLKPTSKPRRDVDQLWDAGKFIASVGSRSVSADGSITDAKRSRRRPAARTAWLRPPPDPSVGDVDARRKLDGQLESLREKLIENSGAPLLRTMELSYAKYPSAVILGGTSTCPAPYTTCWAGTAPRTMACRSAASARDTPSTRRCPRTASGRWRGGSRRSNVNSHTGEYSILLYLNAQDWSHHDHGGALRAEIGEDKVGVSPRGGRLVIFHSDLVIFNSDCIPHAVEEAPERRPRRRRRLAAHAAERRGDFIKGLAAVPAAERLERFGHDGAAKRQFQRCLEHLTDPIEKAYCYARVAHCAFDGLGDARRRPAAWRSAIELDPASAVARAGLGMTTTNATERAEALRRGAGAATARREDSPD